MTNTPAILKSLVVYAVCVPLAVFIGYILTDPLQYATFGYLGVLALVLVSPVLLRWHYPLLVLSWQTSAVVFFLKGSPSWSLVMVATSLLLSVLESILSPDKHFIRVPQLTWPLIFMLAVVVFTAKLTGGFGLRTFGSDVYGGKKYVYLLIGIFSYFAITARPIPPERAKLFVGLFFLGGATKFIGDLVSITPSFLHFIFWVFPPSGLSYFSGVFEVGTTRLSGVGFSGISACYWMLARYGVRGIFLSGKPWRPILFTVFFGLIFLGGFRSFLLQVMAAFVLMFFLEGLHRTPLLPLFAFMGAIALVALVPLAHRLPFTFQRTLAFLPLNLSREAKGEAEGSSEWRYEMWKALLPQVPQHLLLGKGYAITKEDFEFMGASAFHSVDPSQQGLALSADYHSGILSTVLPFGLWGVMAYVWFMVACLWVVYCNWKHGDPSLQTVNLLLFAISLIEFLSYASCISGNDLSNGVRYWAGNVGLSIALNNGVCRGKSRVPALPEEKNQRLSPARPFPRPRPVFQR
ncbi:MAG: O-antigen ligase family protein [Limisphaerales bacterium]